MGNKKAKTYGDILINKPIGILIIGIVSILLGVLFIALQNANAPVSREEAIAYSGTFDYYDGLSENYKSIYFEDGSVYDVYPHTETKEFNDTMNSLAKGTKLYILVNPNNDYVAEVRTESQEILNFEISQQEIDSYDNGYIALGIFACACGVFLIIYVIWSKSYAKKEKTKASTRKNGVLRFANLDVKHKVLLEAKVDNYQICYRRVKSVNELIINGYVYDEKKGIFEGTHKLCAVVDGHDIAAGLDENSYSYIMFDGEIIEEKERLI